MRWLLIILVLVLLGLQVRLWVGEGSLAHQAELDGQLALQKAENEENKNFIIKLNELDY